MKMMKTKPYDRALGLQKEPPKENLPETPEVVSTDANLDEIADLIAKKVVEKILEVEGVNAVFKL